MNQVFARAVSAGSIVAVAGLSLSAASSSSAPKKQPNRPPTVALTSPSSGASFVAGSPITINATASDSDGSVRQVRFYADGDHIGTADKAPYSVTWRNPKTGTYKLTAEATDNQGEDADSAAVKIVVKKDVPPAVAITSPSDRSTVPPAVALKVTADATDSDGSIRAVRFFVDDDHIGTARTAPYEAIWRRPRRGTHRLRAVAIDNSGESAKSAQVIIVVKTAEPPPAPTPVPPTVSLAAPASTDPFTAPATITVSANASDADGTIASVQFFATSAGSTTPIGSSTGPSFSVSWTNVAAGSYSLTAVATDNAGLTATSAAVGIVVAPAPPPPPPPPPNDPAPETLPLVQQGNLVYEGAFRVPQGNFASPNLTDWQAEAPTFEFGGTSIAFNATNNSLFAVGNDQKQLVAEIRIPAIVNGALVGDLSTADILQPFTDVTDLTMDNAHPGQTLKIGGLLPYGNRLYASVYDFYDANQDQVASHFVSGLDLSVPNDATGPFQVGGTLGLPGFAGFVDGYFGLVPKAWQAKFGGPVLNGQCCLNIIGRTSWGPSVSTIDPAQIGVAALPQANPLVYYTQTHPYANAWDVQSLTWNGSTIIRGVVMPEGSRSVLFFGRHGLGQFCYGPGVPADDPLANTPVGDGSTDQYCPDNVDSNKGTHAYPYVYMVWAYDANDLAAVKAGTKNPWDALPYAYWQLPLPFAEVGEAVINGATYDPATQRIFVSQRFGDLDYPVIHVFQVRLP
jgi:hypothetical protein